MSREVIKEGKAHEHDEVTGQPLLTK